MYEGVYEFYADRLRACPNYGRKSGEEILAVVFSCARVDPMLTPEEFNSIITLCEKAHIKMMEDDYNDGWDFPEHE